MRAGERAGRPREASKRTWWLGLCLGLLGVALAWTFPATGATLVLGGAALLLVRVLSTTRLAWHWTVAALVGSLLLSATALGLAFRDWGLPQRAALFALGAQSLFMVLGRDPLPHERRPSWIVLTILGHGFAVLGSLVLLGGPAAVDAAIVCYTSGFSILLLLALWTQRVTAGPGPGWQTILLGVLQVGAGAAVFLDLADLAPRASVSALAAAGFAALAVLADPPRAPARLRRHQGTKTEAWTHAVAFVVLINLSLLAVRHLSLWALRLVFGFFLLWLLVASTMEYLALWHGRAVLRRFKEPPPPRTRTPLTVVVTAADEGEVLRESLERNMAIDHPLRFLVVVAATCRETVDIARALEAAHPDRVEVVEGVSGSKAGDLNDAWKRVGTPLVLMLDADEVIDPRSLDHGLAVLEKRPDVGVVQGRKVSRAPDEGALGRFISVERRFSTLLDHPMQSDLFGTAHFAGSCALLRREVPKSVRGWRTEVLTEDIDFALRLNLSTDWRIVYEPRMVAYESDPTTLRQLARQRSRWGRGWIEVTVSHFPDLFRKADRLGAKRTLAWAFLLMTCVSAPWSVLLPTLLAVHLEGVALGPPPVVAVLLAAYLLPSRLLTYAYAARNDPHIPLEPGWRRWPEFALHAYGWVFFGWVIQLHSLYMELSHGPTVWYVTQKKLRASALEPILRPLRARKGAPQAKGATPSRAAME